MDWRLNMINRRGESFPTVALFTLLLSVAFASDAEAQSDAEPGEWRHAIGTGVFGLNLKGDTEFGTVFFGPVTADDIDLSTSDISDVAQSAFGLGGSSTNGIWTIFYSGGQLKLEDSGSGTTAAGAPVSAELDFESVAGELAAAYNVLRTERHVLGILGGVRYTKHDYDLLVTTGVSSGTRTIDNDWTDVLVGLIYGLAITENVAWATQLDAGFGGSEGTYHGRTGINWRVGGSRWLLSFYADYKLVEFEDGSPADVDYYRYDMDEFGPGIGVSFQY
jgi:hypothetical protein